MSIGRRESCDFLQVAEVVCTAARTLGISSCRVTIQRSRDDADGVATLTEPVHGVGVFTLALPLLGGEGPLGTIRFDSPRRLTVGLRQQLELLATRVSVQLSRSGCARGDLDVPWVPEVASADATVNQHLKDVSLRLGIWKRPASAEARRVPFAVPDRVSDTSRRSRH